MKAFSIASVLVLILPSLSCGKKDILDVGIQSAHASENSSGNSDEAGDSSNTAPSATPSDESGESSDTQSANPASSPTTGPTTNPSSNPTGIPSDSPSGSPTDSPSSEPTAEPSPSCPPNEAVLDGSWLRTVGTSTSQQDFQFSFKDGVLHYESACTFKVDGQWTSPLTLTGDVEFTATSDSKGDAFVLSEMISARTSTKIGSRTYLCQVMLSKGDHLYTFSDDNTTLNIQFISGIPGSAFTKIDICSNP